MDAVPEGHREQFWLLGAGGGPFPLGGKTGQAQFSGYITLPGYEAHGIV